MNSDQVHKLWAEKYRPQLVSDYIFHDKNQQMAVSKMIADRSIPHLLFSGVAGSGKTCLVQILIRELQLDESDVLTLNASDENSVDVIRDKIKNFITTFAMGSFKVVHLSEADYITPQGQGIMRHMMEEYADVARFALTCNYENKIIPAIKSRCQHFRFKAADKNDIAEYVVNILASEHVKFDLSLVDKYISIGYPDIRKIVNLLQQSTIDGTLQQPNTTGEAGDYKFELLDLIESDNWSAARKVVCENVVAEEWQEIYRFLYENLEKAPKFSTQDRWEEGIVVIADHLYKHTICADPEICMASCLIRLSQL
jgi:replication factor C small subunit